MYAGGVGCLGDMYAGGDGDRCGALTKGGGGDTAWVRVVTVDGNGIFLFLGTNFNRLVESFGNSVGGRLKNKYFVIVNNAGTLFKVSCHHL